MKWPVRHIGWVLVDETRARELKTQPGLKAEPWMNGTLFGVLKLGGQWRDILFHEAETNLYWVPPVRPEKKTQPLGSGRMPAFIVSHGRREQAGDDEAAAELGTAVPDGNDGGGSGREK